MEYHKVCGYVDGGEDFDPASVADADLVIFDKEASFTVRNEDQKSRCGWTPYEGETLKGWIDTVFVNGNIVLKDGQLI